MKAITIALIEIYIKIKEINIVLDTFPNEIRENNIVLDEIYIEMKASNIALDAIPNEMRENNIVYQGNQPSQRLATRFFYLSQN